MLAVKHVNCPQLCRQTQPNFQCDRIRAKASVSCFQLGLAKENSQLSPTQAWFGCALPRVPAGGGFARVRACERWGSRMGEGFTPWAKGACAHGDMLFYAAAVRVSLVAACHPGNAATEESLRA